MFRRLRVKLTVLYAGLFCLVLFLIGATAYAVITDNTQRMAREQLAASGAVFDRGLVLRLAHLHASAREVGRDAHMRQATAERNAIVVGALLDDARMRVDGDLSFLVTREGLIVGEGAASNTSVSPGLQVALEREEAPRGVLTINGRIYMAATAPMPDNLGWVVMGARLDEAQTETLEHLSATPLQARFLWHGAQGWLQPGAASPDALDAFTDSALAVQDERAMRTPDGDAIALVHALPSLDGTRSVLLLQYPLSGALSPYGALFNILFGISALGIALLLWGTWMLARGITQPLLTLEEAAKHLQQGVYDTIVVPGKDELSRLAEAFNTMIGAIRERERKITQLAYHDAETRLPNRLAMERRLAGTAPQRLYLAAVGVDRFAHMRGAIGYALAGAAMRALGARLAHLAPNAPMARLSSDTFGAAFLADDDADARKRAAALVANLEEPLSLDGQHLDVNVTIGLAQPRGKNESPAAMIERASVALDQARTATQKVAMFDEAAYGDPARNLSLMGEMRRAMETGDITVVHQPKYNYRTGRIDSAECLVRWQHPTRGVISPDLFVPMAEETGHIRALTEWVLRRAVADQQLLSGAGHKLTLSVNISGRLLSDSDFARHALSIIRQAPHQLCFEITETAVIDNPKLALENIDLFAQNGVRIAIDDYGSGLSSLAYLKQLPAHELKIDKMFVESLTANRRDALLVRSTIDLAHGLGMEVTAEGVETPAAFALLAAMRCDLAQGYLVARPSSVDELIALIGDERRLRFYQQTAASGGSGPHEVPGPQPKTA
jgi:EAL domain-containing protein (putative c-di-GMP-specific phosphodiesterase class I)/GGDEF domain-containing protein